MPSRTATLALLGALLGLFACAPTVPGRDAGSAVDAGSTEEDAGRVRLPDAGDTPDAGQGYDLSCAGMSPGPAAADHIAVFGVATVGRAPTPNVLVQLFDASDATLSTPLDMGTTLADGRFAFDLDLVARAPRAVVLRGDPPSAAIRRAYVFVPRGLNADTELPLPLYDDPAWNGAYLAASATANPTRGTVLVQVSDCAGVPLPGATIALDRTQPDTVLTYLEGDTPSARASTDPGGQALVLNAPTGDVTITLRAQGDAVQLGDATINVRADRLTVLLWQ